MFFVGYNKGCFLWIAAFLFLDHEVFVFLQKNGTPFPGVWRYAVKLGEDLSINMRSKYFVALLFFHVLMISESFAQEDIFGIDTRATPRGRKSESPVGNILRNALSSISFELAGGGAFQMNELLFISDDPSQYNINQFRNQDFPIGLTASDTLNFTGNSTAYPLNGGFRINLFNSLTLGGGYGREYGRSPLLQGGDYEFSFEKSRYTFDKFYGSVGLVLYDANKRIKFLNWKYRKYASQNYYMQSQKRQRIRQDYPWRFILEGQIGNMIIRESFDPSLSSGNEPFYNAALRVERDFSEYARMFVKLGFEQRIFLLAAQNQSEFQKLEQSLVFGQVGMSLSFPGTKRCKVEGCGVVMKHLHNGVEYRGSSIFRPQNRKVGQWYK